MTQSTYNYQGDRIDLSQSQGKQSYAVIEPINNENTGEDVSSIIQSSDVESQSDGPEGVSAIKDQIKELNDSIEDSEIKIIRLKKKQRGEVKAKFSGEVIYDEIGLFDQSVPVVRIVSSENTLIKGTVNEYDFYLMQEDRPVEIYVKAEDRNLEGKVSNFDKFPPIMGGGNQSIREEGGGSLSTSSGNNGSLESGKFGFSIVCDDFIQPGFSVNVKVLMPGFAIPKDVIIKEKNNNYVFLYDNGIAKKVLVHLERQGTQMIVNQGLNEGDKLIQFPQHLKDGQKIAIKTKQATS